MYVPATAWPLHQNPRTFHDTRRFRNLGSANVGSLLDRHQKARQSCDKPFILTQPRLRQHFKINRLDLMGKCPHDRTVTAAFSANGEGPTPRLLLARQFCIFSSHSGSDSTDKPRGMTCHSHFFLSCKRQATPSMPRAPRLNAVLRLRATLKTFWNFALCRPRSIIPETAVMPG